MAAVRYTVALLTTPSLVDSLELFFGHTQAWKYYSYLYQLCYNRFYAILLRDGDALCAWRVERLLLTSSHLQEERNGLFDRSLSQDADHIDMIATVLCTKYRIQDDRTIYNRLKRSLTRLVEINTFKAEITARAEQSYEQGKKEHEGALRTLWRNMKPETELKSMITKQWQDIGFQGTSPSTDFRSTGLLGLDQVLYLSYNTPARAQRLVEESVEGGAHWYPLAIVSIAMTDYLLTLLNSSQLTLYLLLSPSTEFEAFNALHTSLLHAFHEHWLHLCSAKAPEDRPTVMAFERVFAKWRKETTRWLVRGVVAGWWDSRGFLKVQVQEGRKERAKLVNIALE